MSGFRRVVLELGHGVVDPTTLREAAAFARLLDAELHALFVEDETVLRASALPFTREISALSYQWRGLEPERLEAELRTVADQARQQVIAAASAIGARQNFEVRRGDLAFQILDFCAASDIVVVTPPPGNLTHGSRRPREAAEQSTASVLFLPRVALRRHGSIVAVVSGTGDPSLAIARSIAARSTAHLLVLAPPGSEVDADVRWLPGTAVPDIVATLGDVRERLIVLTRDVSADLSGPELAAARGAAVLVVEPA